MKKLKIGVIGVGRLGKEHARIYSKLSNVELVGIVDIDRNQAEETAKTYGVKAYTLDNIIPKIDAASVVVPTDKHYEIAKMLLHSGIHLLVEKPMASSVLQAGQIVNLAMQKGVILQIGHIERFNPIIQNVSRLIRNPRFIEIHRLSPFTHRGTDVGVVLDLMIHDIDIILDMVKDKIQRIDAVGVNVLTPYEDIANARIKFKNGCAANLTASRVSPERMRKIRVFQKDSYISVDYYKQAGKAFYKKGGQILKKDLEAGRQEPLELELKAFAKCVLKNKRPLVNGEDALQSLKLADRIIKKIKGGK